MNKDVNPQEYANLFENIIRKVFKSDRSGAFGIAEADFIRRNPLVAVTATCFYLYAKTGEEKKQEIEEFLKDANFVFQFDFDTLLSFESNTKIINGIRYELDYENGEEAILALKEKFKNICK